MEVTEVREEDLVIQLVEVEVLVVLVAIRFLVVIQVMVE